VGVLAEKNIDVNLLIKVKVQDKELQLTINEAKDLLKSLSETLKALTLQQEIPKPSAPSPDLIVARPHTKYRILEALKSGQPKRRIDLLIEVQASESAFDQALRDLVREGKVVKIKAGVYKLAEVVNE
jgi:hypothetical protein